ncbi:hypothetical protein [Pontibacter ruber]|uniref:Lipocalin-like domain-containing protein n=1 Tax=Pontibacter ruber TaxID=1343895 RepID=A0ABW5CTG2_9BACT|nr:hypothetical protein [Pontibacter ruber]
MKNLRLLFFLFLSVLIVPLVSCDDDDDDAEPSRRELLTSGQWTAFGLYQGNQDMTPLLVAAGLNISDMKITFKDDGTYTATAVDGSQDSGTWEFTNNEQAILFDKGDQDNELTAVINKLDNSELFLEGEIETDNGTMEGEIRFRR